MVYVPNTYFAVGNDGNHFNDPVNAGTNYSVSSTVLSALYSLSDHLPVIADFDIDLQGLNTAELEVPVLENPMRQPAQLADYYLRYGLAIYTLDGRKVFEKPEGEPAATRRAGGAAAASDGGRPRVRCEGVGEASAKRASCKVGVQP